MCGRAFTDEARIKYTTQKGKVRFVSCCAHSARTGGETAKPAAQYVAANRGSVCVSSFLESVRHVPPWQRNSFFINVFSFLSHCSSHVKL